MEINNLEFSQIYPPFGLPYEFNWNDSELSNDLLFIENNNALTDDLNIEAIQNNFDIAQNEVLGNNNNVDSMNDDIIDDNANLNIEINQLQINPVNSNQHRRLGRKREDSDLVGEHTAYSEDNMIRKYKIYYIESARIKINSQLQKAPISIEINGKKYKANQILKFNQDIAKNINVLEMRKFMNNDLKTIFSVDISDIYKNYPKNFNQLLIKKLYEENISNVTCILDIKVSDSLKYFRKDRDVFLNQEYACLKGIEKRFDSLPQYLSKKGHKDDYINKFFNLIKNFENIIEKRGPRQTRTNYKTIDTQN